ncbi:MAG: tetratricopeptide repeat protein [Candidatus Sumerlaeaceae bacterium]
MYLRSSFVVFASVAVAAGVALSGCNRRTPEERLQKAVEFYQQNDTLSAEVEARKVIEKNADDPAAIQARMLLAQIYVRDQRFDEARAELEPALEKVSQKDRMGQAVLKTYLSILQREKKYDDALKTIDRFQQKYASDEGTSLNLAVARADTQTMAGHTSGAREALSSLRENTTSPAEINLYRGMIVTTYHRDRDSTGAIEYMEKELAAVTGDDEKRGLASQLAEMYAAVEDYTKARTHAIQATELYDKGMATELDVRMRSSLTFELAKMYIDIGNLAGARVAFQALFDSAPQEPQLIMATVAGLTEALIRQGEVDAAVGFVKEAATRYPTAPFAQQAAQLETMQKEGRLADMVETGTLAMRFKEEALLAPKNLPKAVETSATISVAIAQTTGSAETTGAASAAAPADQQTTDSK